LYVKMPINPRAILDFWFKETPPERWFIADPAFDALIRERFEETWRSACVGGMQSWGESMERALALVLLFDQFPRNMFRGSAEAFASDTLAREVARAALKRGFDLEAPAGARSFFYLPLMHSEDSADQELCLRLTRERLGEAHFSYPYAVRHLNTVGRFGRFPARNTALDRPCTPEETQFLIENPAGF
jgi:uncharacterized protein (DUF924 family)